MTNPIQLAILLGRGERADMAIEELWRRAQSAVSGTGVQIRCVAVYAQTPGATNSVSHGEVDVVVLEVPTGGGLARLVNSWAAKPGPLGIVARLAKHNLASRRVARAMKANRRLTEVFCRSDVIVSADPEADRAVWRLRRRTRAHLMHGAFAMASALSAVAKD